MRVCSPPCRLRCEACCLLQMAGLPLPLEEHGVSPSNIYDLHAAHSDSGATDDSSTPYIPPTWKQFNEGVPQVR